MPKKIGNFSGRSAELEKLGRAGMSKRLWTETQRRDTELHHSTMHHCGNRRLDQWPIRAVEGDEYVWTGTLRSRFLDVPSNCLRNGVVKEKVMPPATFRTANQQCFVVPVDIVEPQTDGLTGANAVERK